MPVNLITILGPTASGKTRLAVRLALEFNGEIISADSRQVYCQMNIGTGKDLEDYEINGTRVPYHLIDIVEPDEEFNVFEFRRYFYRAFNGIIGKNKFPFMVGGSGLYLSSILQKYDLKKAEFNSSRAGELKHLDSERLKKILLSKKKVVHNKTDLLDKERIIRAILVAEAGPGEKENIPVLNAVVIGIKAEKDVIKNRITERLKRRLNAGMIEEVEEMIKSGITHEKLNFLGLEYRYTGLYIRGELSYNDMFQKLNSAIYNFAKRQMTWFRKMEREGVKINWIETSEYLKASKIIKDNIYA